ncbi:MAG: DUF3817 domain-containing protein [Epsilonproteobacteria bacterium]|nr:DUF3817 domain-containing protein [Campylobacterota bacterium]
MNSSVKLFKKIAIYEGWSYIILLFIAMPLKYLFGYPIAVKIAGMTHGILFILFCWYQFEAYTQTRWSHRENLLFFISSLIPFGTFFIKSKLEKYELQ